MRASASCGVIKAFMVEKESAAGGELAEGGVRICASRYCLGSLGNFPPAFMWKNSASQDGSVF